MRTVARSILPVLVLAASVLTPMSVQAEEVPLTRDELIATSTNTVKKGTRSDGVTFEIVYGSDGTVKDTERWPAGTWDTDEGKWSIVESSDGPIVCITWNKWGASCWRDFRDGNQYMSREQGGKERTTRWTVAPR